jgi:hypothetical protein
MAKPTFAGATEFPGTSTVIPVCQLDGPGGGGAEGTGGK